MPDSFQISCVVTCKGRLHHLRQTLPGLVGQPGVQVILVDYDCPDHCGDWAETHYPMVRVVRVQNSPSFNLSRARNAGALAAETPWLAFLDADIIVDPHFFETVFPLLRTGCYFLGDERSDGLWGTCLLERKIFQKVGGYDEVIDSWGCEDVDLYRQLGIAGVRPRTFPASLLRCIEHGDGERLRFQPVAALERSWRIGHLYTLIKNDTTVVAGQKPGEAQRRKLRKAVTDAVERAATQGSARLEITLPPARLPGKRSAQRKPPQLTRRMVYEISDYGEELPNEG
jgi:glycosyltransferase involved in cell wall biosynthesis